LFDNFLPGQSFCGKKEREKGREREKGEIVEERDVYHTLPFLRIFYILR
jgi:hypothetical protein